VEEVEAMKGMEVTTEAMRETREETIRPRRTTVAMTPLPMTPVPTTFPTIRTRRTWSDL